MKRVMVLKTVIVALLLLWSTANAQSPHAGEQAIKASQEIPEMPLWWRAPESPELGNNHYVGEGVTFLPNFYNGMPAMALRTADDSIRTWLNRFPGDTQNIFTWRAGYIKQGDFNGDGIIDYIDGEGNVYRGIQNGQPPEKEPVTKYNLAYPVDIIHDFNHDGFDDIMLQSTYNRFGRLTTILYGGNDLTKLPLWIIDRAAPMDTNRSLTNVYLTPEGETRFILYYKENAVRQGYEIYRVIWQTGATVPTYEKLSEHNQNPFAPDYVRYIPDAAAIYQSKHHNKTFLFLSEMLEGDYYKNNVHIFDITDGTFTETLKFRMDPATNFTMLEGSVDGDQYEDWCIRGLGKQCWFFSGGIKFDSIPKMKTGSFADESIAFIQDISNDGVGDIAVAGINFSIIEGINIPGTGIEFNNNQLSQFSFTETSPHPVVSSGTAFVSVTINNAAQYALSLYSLEGQIITKMFRGWLDAGNQTLPLDISPYNLAAGSYLLRLSDGTQSIQRTIIISN